MDRHAQSDSKRQVIYITKIYCNTKLVFRMRIFFELRYLVDDLIDFLELSMFINAFLP